MLSSKQKKHKLWHAETCYFKRKEFSEITLSVYSIFPFPGIHENGTQRTTKDA